MLHVGLVHETKFRKGCVVGRVVMRRDVALKWDGWESVATRWLEQQPAEVDLLETVEAYVAKIAAFQTWYTDEREKVDWRELRYAEQLRRAVLALRGQDELPQVSESHAYGIHQS